MAGSRVGLFDNLNIPIHRDAQHREDRGVHEAWMLVTRITVIPRASRVSNP